jgi:hypothetical protein
VPLAYLLSLLAPAFEGGRAPRLHIAKLAIAGDRQFALQSRGLFSQTQRITLQHLATVQDDAHLVIHIQLDEFELQAGLLGLLLHMPQRLCRQALMADELLELFLEGAPYP